MLIDIDGDPDDIDGADGADVTLALTLGNPDVGEDVTDVESVTVTVLFDEIVGSPEEGDPTEEVGITVLFMETDALPEGLMVGLTADVTFVVTFVGPVIRMALIVQ